ncbi:alpha/beta hydrolase [Streptomyces iconiensis]|uniref:Alpha/beta hydrolase n=1 Tax=Streptomyces iconiensis TaxID=1384038 RepID=A0ABT6ZNK3_9ACTN|nr:alpha/beta hydrolase [Streptomyces iconiensis]MDJ1130630.1 alpha/beta hydrolase [Streptomyces iconiensis]
MSGSGFPSTGVPGTTAWRALLALAVVFVLLATTGWTALRKHDMAAGPLAAAQAAWEKGSFGGHSLPDVDAPPRTIARFFSALDSAQRRTLAQRHPLVVGNLGGAPVKLRYKANHKALLQSRDTERHRMTDDRLTDEGRQEAGRRMHRFESMLQPGRQILAFDPTGRGRAAEVFGDLDQAQRVSVVVPGVDTDLLTFERSSRPYSAPVGMARSLQRQQHATAPYVRTATVAWADYTAPVGLGVDAASGGPARDGADRLDSFVRSLPATSRGSAPKVSLFCHSYGSVVCGVGAGRMPRAVSDIAVAGSPGMRVDNAQQLGTNAHVWAMRDRDDWIADVPHMNVGGLGHGADPVAGGFGSRHLSAAGANGHTGYFVPHTQSLANFAAIGTGSYGDVGCVTSDPECSSVT